MRAETVPSGQKFAQDVTPAGAAQNFLREVIETGTLPTGVDAQEMTSAVVCALLTRLDLEEGREVLDALPPDLQAMLGSCPVHQGSRGEPIDKKEFLTRIATHFQLTAAAVEPASRSVLGALRVRLTSRVAAMVGGQLPHDLLSLWQSSQGRATDAGAPRIVNSTADLPTALSANPMNGASAHGAPRGQGAGDSGFQWDIRSRGFELTPAIRQYAADHVIAKLQKHATHIQAVIVRFEDVNGTKGGPDKCCRIEVVIPAENPLVVSETAGDLRAAMDLAADRMENLVQRQLEQRRGTR